VVEGALGLLARLHHIHSQRVDEVDVLKAIVVVVNERYSSAHRFDYVSFFRRGDMLECNAGLLSDIRKTDTNRLSVDYPETYKDRKGKAYPEWPGDF
jgi:hypothetical protein